MIWSSSKQGSATQRCGCAFVNVLIRGAELLRRTLENIWACCSEPRFKVPLVARHIKWPLFKRKDLHSPIRMPLESVLLFRCGRVSQAYRWWTECFLLEDKQCVDVKLQSRCCQEHVFTQVQTFTRGNLCLTCPKNKEKLFGSLNWLRWFI